MSRMSDLMASLENVDGFSNVTWMGGALLLFDNSSLTNCCGVYQLLCADPPACTDDAIGGPAIIFNNPLGCNSAAEIIAGGPCPEEALQAPIEVITSEIHSRPEVSVYPNPADDRIEIDLSHFSSRPVDIRMVNNLGETLWTRDIQDAGIERHLKISLTSSIPNGLYYLVFVQDDEVVSEPLIVQR